MRAFLGLLSKTGYFNPWVDMTNEDRFALLNWKFWAEVSDLGLDVVPLRAYCWKMTGRPEVDFVENLPW